jgi:hypothetical protein
MNAEFTRELREVAVIAEPSDAWVSMGYHGAHAAGVPVTSAQVAAVVSAVETAIREHERRRIMSEMAALGRELEQVGRLALSQLVKDMWTRVNRRLDKS